MRGVSLHFITTFIPPDLTSTPDNAVLRTLHYFDFFDHALSLEELHRFLGVALEQDLLERSLQVLVSSGRVVEQSGWYGLKEQSVQLRIAHQSLNQRKLRQARRVGRFIQWFPFVRGVYLSGSLSKQGVQSKEDDLDFFILTAPKRVWTAKLFLIAFKKVFLLDTEKYFCINLLMDQERLEIGKQNIYTATEVVSLVTLQHELGRTRFLSANSWVKRYFPNVVIPDSDEPFEEKFHPLERAIDVLFGERLELWAQRKFAAHMEAHTDAKEGYFEAESHSSAYFPQSVEQRLMAHLDTFEDDK